MIILASKSPRRRELLKQIGCRFICESSDTDEVKTGAPEELVMVNARMKAANIAAKHKDTWIIGADTIVALDNRIYGKPADTEEAAAMLGKIAGRTHEVYTGIALVYNDECWQDMAVTQVEMAAMTNNEIHKYVLTGEPLDKAGAYAIQGKCAVFIKGINGSYSNVVGLPLQKLYELSAKAGLLLSEG
ncbi:Maf family protein [Pectinatus frisingensis]|uniref:Maf family protein n=1 Tax=Pectinatus frisingensis TaxID=865 RepID=UPI0018C54863|nr:Maf family protein [Pectinatus frisingensis]